MLVFGSTFWHGESYIKSFSIISGMATAVANEEFKGITNMLEGIKLELDFIKKHMVDIDSILTEEDYFALQDYRMEKAGNKLISHKQLKKELNI